MRCDQIQPNLLDYGKGLLSGAESREIRAHIENCAECAALLEEEMAFSARLAALPEEQPRNDVWALVRARTRHQTRPFAWLQRISTFPASVQRAVAAAVVAIVVAVTVYSFTPSAQPPASTQKPSTTAVVKWSDDPIGGHTDAMVKYIDSM